MPKVTREVVEAGFEPEDSASSAWVPLHLGTDLQAQTRRGQLANSRRVPHRQGGSAPPAPLPLLLLPPASPDVYPTYPTAWVSRVEHGPWPGVGATNPGKGIFILELMGRKFWAKGCGLKLPSFHQPLGYWPTSFHFLGLG